MNYGRKIEKVKSVNGFAAAMVINNLLGSGRVCRVDYRKKNGERTTMICRTGVSAYVTGNGKRVTNLEDGIIGVWSFDRGGYRTLKADSITAIKSGSTMYVVGGLGSYTHYRPNLYGKRTYPAITSPLY